MSGVRCLVLLVAGVGAIACNTETGGRIEVSWTGSDTAKVVLPAKASWCAAGRYLEIRATQQDTGVAVALFSADSTPAKLAGNYRLLAEPVDSLRPVGVVGVRWADPGAVSGMRSDTGKISLRQESAGTLAGELTAGGFFLGSTRRRLNVTGRFQGLTIDTAPADCPVLLPPSPAPDSSVDSLHGNDVLP